jgi:glucokinase
VVYVTISTGIGAGIVVGGRIVLPRLSGGELGFTIIDRPAALAKEPATVEELGSGTALARMAAERGIDADSIGRPRTLRAPPTTDGKAAARPVRVA